MPTIPTPVFVPDAPGYGSKQTADDTVALAGFDAAAAAEPIASLIFDGGAVFLRLADLTGKTLPTGVHLAPNGNIQTQDHQGNPLNY